MLIAFDGISFWTHGIVPSLEVQLGGKTIAIEVEVVDVPLDHNILLGSNWIYNMQATALSLFWVVFFLWMGGLLRSIISLLITQV